MRDNKTRLSLFKIALKGRRKMTRWWILRRHGILCMQVALWVSDFFLIVNMYSLFDSVNGFWINVSVWATAHLLLPKLKIKPNFLSVACSWVGGGGGRCAVSQILILMLFLINRWRQDRHTLHNSKNQPSESGRLCKGRACCSREEHYIGTGSW